MVEAGEDDVPDIVNLWVELMEFHAALDPYFDMAEDARQRFETYLRGCLGSPDHSILLARWDGEAAGYCHAARQTAPRIFATPHYCEILEIAVSTGFRECGIGAALLERTLGWAREWGFERVLTRVAMANPGADRFWRAAEFRAVTQIMVREL